MKQHSNKYLANGKKEWEWLSYASYPYTIIQSLAVKLGNSLMEMIGRVAWNILYDTVEVRFYLLCGKFTYGAAWSPKPGWV